MHVKSDGVGNVEDFPSELEVLAFRDLERFGKPHVYTEVALAAKVVSYARFSRIGEAVAVRRDVRWIGKNLGNTRRAEKKACVNTYGWPAQWHIVEWTL